MSKFEVNLSESFSITKKGDSSVFVSLNRQEALDLVSTMASKLGLYVSKNDPNILWNVGDFIPANAQEPDLPEGSRIQDHSTYSDIAVRVGDRWEWETLLGSRERAGHRNSWKWSDWEEQAWTVLSIGK